MQNSNSSRSLSPSSIAAQEETHKADLSQHHFEAELEFVHESDLDSSTLDERKITVTTIPQYTRRSPLPDGVRLGQPNSVDENEEFSDEERREDTLANNPLQTARSPQTKNEEIPLPTINATLSSKIAEFFSRICGC